MVIQLRFTSRRQLTPLPLTTLLQQVQITLLRLTTLRLHHIQHRPTIRLVNIQHHLNIQPRLLIQLQTIPHPRKVVITQLQLTAHRVFTQARFTTPQLYIQRLTTLRIQALPITLLLQEVITRVRVITRHILLQIILLRLIIHQATIHQAEHIVALTTLQEADILLQRNLIPALQRMLRLMVILLQDLATIIRPQVTSPRDIAIPLHRHHTHLRRINIHHQALEATVIQHLEGFMVTQLQAQDILILHLLPITLQEEAILIHRLGHITRQEAMDILLRIQLQVAADMHIPLRPILPQVALTVRHLMEHHPTVHPLMKRQAMVRLLPMKHRLMPHLL